MRTVIVSDTHLASGGNADVLRNPAALERLLPAIEGADRLVLLGDVVEMRDRPLRAAFEIALPILREIGEAAGEIEVVLVPGNHDHRFIEPWLEERRIAGEPAMGLEHSIEPPDWPGKQLAAAMPAASLRFSYPGIWLADGVYATHGHYLDRHLTIPTLERLGIAMVERVLGTPPGGPDPLAPPGSAEPEDPDEYERAAAPVLAVLYQLAQGGPEAPRGAGSPTARVWRMLQGGDTRISKLRGWLLGSVALPGAVGVANRLGFGPVRPDLSATAIARAGVEAMGEVLERLEIEAEHVIFGHTHRRGPLAGEEAWTEQGTNLLNTGSWTFVSSLVGRHAASAAYWPGTIAVLEDGEPPRLEHLLDDVPRGELAGGGAGSADASGLAGQAEATEAGAAPDGAEPEAG
jgi:predicted phosphodiesterase